jgi:hypothetical protein
MTEWIKCDACVARAVNNILLPSGGIVNLCQHHTNQHEVALKEAAAVISTLEVAE